MNVKDYFPRINEDGYIFILIFAVIGLFLSLFSTSLGWVGLIVTVWCIYFFRDPVRVIPDSDHLIISPADGTVANIEEVAFPKELGLGKLKGTRVSIFLNIFDVHINRLPISGNVEKLHYHPGAFFNASLDKASEENERQYVHIRTKNKKDIVVTQIAGLIARRIVCFLSEGSKVNIGKRFGLIRFGSRVDLYLPEGVHPVVNVKQKMIAGETIIASLKNDLPKIKTYISE